MGAIAAAALFLQQAISGAMRRRRRRRKRHVLTTKHTSENIDPWEDLEVSERGNIVLEGFTDLVWAGK